MSMIYRSYNVEKHPDGGYVIKLNGNVVCSQPSLDFAHHWIDGEKKRIREITMRDDPEEDKE